jgi:putative transposase
MPRKKRDLAENGFYHVFNRGISKKHIQFGTMFHDIFFSQLLAAKYKFNVEIHAFCLMSNHYHLLLRTPDANLDKFMQHFGSSLSRKINRLCGADGALFRSRYKSILVESHDYFIQLLKYIHLNPVDALLTQFAEDYELSSYSTYLCKTTISWLTKEFALGFFNDIHAFKAFHETGTTTEISKLLSKKQLPTTL